MSKALKSVIFLVILLAASVFVVQSISLPCTPFTPKYTVMIECDVSTNPSPLIVHCKSGEEDLGRHELERFKFFNFTFCSNIFNRTLYFCSFEWGNKYQTFDVFNKRIMGNCTDRLCHWLAEYDGFFLSGGDDSIDFQERYEWNLTKSSSDFLSPGVVVSLLSMFLSVFV